MNHFDKEKLQEIINFANYMEINPLFSIFNFEAYELISSFNLAEFKIASRTVIDEPDLVKQLLTDKKKINYFIRNVAQRQAAI